MLMRWAIIDLDKASFEINRWRHEFKKGRQEFKKIARWDIKNYTGFPTNSALGEFPVHIPYESIGPVPLRLLDKFVHKRLGFTGDHTYRWNFTQKRRFDLKRMLRLKTSYGKEVVAGFEKKREKKLHDYLDSINVARKAFLINQYDDNLVWQFTRKTRPVEGFRPRYSLIKRFRYLCYGLDRFEKAAAMKTLKMSKNDLYLFNLHDSGRKINTKIIKITN